MATGDRIETNFGTFQMSTLASTIVITGVYTTTIISQILVTNLTNLTRTFNIGLNGNSAFNSNCMFFNMPLAPNDTLVFDCAIKMTYPGQYINVTASAANSVNITILGWGIEP